MSSDGAPVGRGVSYRDVLLHALAFVLTALPLWKTTVPALVDYPNHLARMHVLHNLAESPALQAHYEVRWQVQAYFAMEVVVLPLMQVTDVYTAGRLFLVASLGLTVAGVLGLQWLAYGRVHASAFLVYPVLYSTNLGWGFVTFVFGVGVALCWLAGLLALEGRPYLTRVAWLLVGATLLFLLHLIAFGVFAALVGCVATARTRWFSLAFFRQGLATVPTFLPAVALWWLTPPLPAGPGITEGWLHPVKFLPMTFNADYAMSVLSMVPVAAALYVGWREGVLGIGSPELRRCLLVTGLVSLVVPERLLDIGLVGTRFPYVWMLLLAASVEWRPHALRHVALRILAAGGAALYVGRHLSVAASLQTCDELVEEFRAATQHLPRGTRVTAVINRADTPACGNVHWPEHVVTIAVIERDAFVPTLFMKAFPVSPAARHDDPGYNSIIPPTIDAFFPGSPHYEATPAKMRDWRRNFDHLAYFHFGNEVMIPHTREVGRGSWFTLFAVEPEPEPRAP